MVYNITAEQQNYVVQWGFFLDKNVSRPILKYLIMSEDEVEKIDGSNIKKIFAYLEPELERRRYLKERYTREKQLAEYRQATTDDEKAKQPIITSLEKNNTDIAAGYILGKPVNYYNRKNPANKIEKRIDFTGHEREFLVVDEEELKKQQQENNEKEISKEEKYLREYIEICIENNEAKHNIDLAQDALSCTTAYEIIYKENGKIKFGKFDPLQCTMIYSNKVSSTPQPIGFIRRYLRIDYFSDNNDNTIEVYELYTKNRRVAYHFKSGDDAPFQKVGLFTENPESIYAPEGFKNLEIPINEYPMCERIGLYEQQVPSIEEYERTQTSTKRLLRFNETDAKLLLAGIDGEPEENETREEQVLRILNSLILYNPDPEGKADFAKYLTKDIDDTAMHHHKETLRADIFAGMGIFDQAKADRVYHSETGLKYKLYGLESKMSEFEKIFKEGLDRRRKIITQLINIDKGTDYDYTTIGVTFTRNIPLSLTEYATLANMLKDILPLEEVYKMLPMIENPYDMVERYEKWQITLAELQAKIQKIQANATEADIIPERIKDNMNNGADNDNAQVA